jgi:hypothetical protein
MTLMWTHWSNSIASEMRQQQAPATPVAPQTAASRTAQAVHRPGSLPDLTPPHPAGPRHRLPSPPSITSSQLCTSLPFHAASSLCSPQLSLGHPRREILRSIRTLGAPRLAGSRHLRRGSPQTKPSTACNAWMQPFRPTSNPAASSPCTNSTGDPSPLSTSKARTSASHTRAGPPPTLAPEPAPATPAEPLSPPMQRRPRRSDPDGPRLHPTPLRQPRLPAAAGSRHRAPRPPDWVHHNPPRPNLPQHTSATHPAPPARSPPASQASRRWGPRR